MVAAIPNGAALLALGVVVAVVAVLFLVMRQRRAPDDDVESFRRQIDALSAESRRPTIDKMKPDSESSTNDDGDDAP
jgi:hypothetical protein